MQFFNSSVNTDHKFTCGQLNNIKTHFGYNYEDYFVGSVETTYIDDDQYGHSFKVNCSLYIDEESQTFDSTSTIYVDNNGKLRGMDIA